MTRKKTASRHRCLRCGLFLLPANGGAWKHVANHHTGRGCTAPHPMSLAEYERHEAELVAGARAVLSKARGES